MSRQKAEQEQEYEHDGNEIRHRIAEMADLGASILEEKRFRNDASYNPVIRFPAWP